MRKDETMEWKCGAYCFRLDRPILMGVLNVTPDSFSDGGMYDTYQAAMDQAGKMLAEGADIIDVGGESTRAGATPVSPGEELKRVMPIVRDLADDGVCVSIDTRHPEVARACVDAGASILNDISGFRDPGMIGVAAESDAGCIIVHMQGDPATMQIAPTYNDVVSEVRDYLVGQAGKLMAAGVGRNRICIDAGPGFGKLPRHSYDLVHHTDALAATGFPVVAAVSRKSYIGHIFQIKDPLDRDEVSASEAFHACYLGARIVRTHNVACTAKALDPLLDSPTLLR